MSGPPPPPPPAPPLGESKQLYLTPVLKKRKDGLAPQLLRERQNDNGSALSKSYRTSSFLLYSLKGCAGDEAAELSAIVASIQECLEDNEGRDKDYIGLDFTPSGCSWVLGLNPSIGGGAEKSYYIEVNCSARSLPGANNTAFEVTTSLIPKLKEVDPKTPNLKGFREAKAAFDFMVLQVRKTVVKIEFPEFPEGCKGRAFREVYQLNARLKSGSFATVCRGTHRATGKKVAIKCVLRKDLPPPDDAAIYDEVAILASLNHPHIVPLIDFFDEKDCYFLVMELMSGGDLFDRIGKKKSYSEADARDLIVKMLKSVAYCHAAKIAHCDMKPKNLLLMSEDNDSYIKLADFGFAARCHEPKSLTKQCGTPFFVSPEILMRKAYDQQSDMWSVGCIVFLLLSGNLPFMGRSQKELFRKIVAGKFVFAADDWDDISPEAKDLVHKTLVLDPDDRMTAMEALRHPWLKTSRDQLNQSQLDGTAKRLKTFNARMKLRSAMIAVDWVSSLKRNSFMGMTKANATTPAKTAAATSGLANLTIEED